MLQITGKLRTSILMLVANIVSLFSKVVSVVKDITKAKHERRQNFPGLPQGPVA